jgi:hypothetical protein
VIFDPLPATNPPYDLVKPGKLAVEAKPRSRSVPGCLKARR